MYLLFEAGILMSRVMLPADSGESPAKDEAA
jgi:hypothetical protein